jgi:hypothetical protein
MAFELVRNRIGIGALRINASKEPNMASSKYYRRQSDLCLQLALLQNDPQMTLSLVGLAKELRAKADERDGAPASAATDLTVGSRTNSGLWPGYRH